MIESIGLITFLLYTKARHLFALGANLDIVSLFLLVVAAAAACDWKFISAFGGMCEAEE